MLTRDFDYDLPDALVAQEAAERGTSRLLVADAEGEERHRRVADLPQILRPGDLLVVNDSRVIPARLFGRRLSVQEPGGAPEPGARVELLLVERLDDTIWEALARPGRKARPGTRLVFTDAEAGDDAPIVLEAPPILEATVVDKRDDGRHVVTFSEPVEPHLERLGHVPLPPYIKRPDRPEDRRRYQTVYARHPGSVAAPTAGLHFDEALLEGLAAAGVDRAPVTLHVGIGTFQPVTASLVHEHVMESELWEVSEATAEAIARTRAAGGRVVAVGTTVVRTLESAALAGGGTVEAGSGRTELFITPGFEFRAVDVLLTNFHLPRSTLLMLVSAFAGRERILAVYREAVERRYRFYSYGDAMLVARRDGER